MPVTIEDVAHAAGVGVGTVSRVLNDSPKVSPATRARVLEIITRLQYRPTAAARNLSRKTRTPSIGVITQPFFSFHSFAERLRGAQAMLSESGSEYELVLYGVNALAHINERIALITKTSACDALIVIDMEVDAEQKQAMIRTRIPFVGINHFHQPDWICIGTDNVEGGRLATEFLIGLGHRHIAYVGDQFTDFRYEFRTSRERFEGFQTTISQHGLVSPPEHIRLTNYGYEPAKREVAEMLKIRPLPTAIFAMSDIQALGAVAAIREAGLRVPEDISVLGYDDLEISYHTGLSTVQQHLEQSGRTAIAYLLHQLQPTKYAAPPLTLPALRVVERQTTRPYQE